MRAYVAIVAFAFVSSLCSTQASAQRERPSAAQVEHARKMKRALEDYDAQLARRERELDKENARLTRESARLDRKRKAR